MRDLTTNEQRAIEHLRNAFRGVKHGIWTGGKINAASSRYEYLERLRQKSEGAWSPQEIDWLFFKAATTVGDDETVKYAFVRLVELLLQDAVSGSVSETIIVSKLEYAHFPAWPEAQRRAALGALQALSDYWASLEHWNQDMHAELDTFIASQSGS